MKIGFIGTGNMGGAILKGYAKSEASNGNEILIHNRSTEHNEQMAAAMTQMEGTKIRVCNDNRQLAEEADIIIIGVKPKDVERVLKEISPVKDKIIVSMAAGVSISSMEKAMGNPYARIIRIMPNTPAQVGEAMTSMSRNTNVSDGEFEDAKAIFSSVGKCEEVDEDMIDCVIGVSGSSTAYTYMYIEALVQAACDNGMEEEQARAFAAQSVLGAAKMALESSESLEQLRINVCSPGGTTIEAVNTLFANGFMDDVKEGFQAAVDRSKEMTKE
ncbi:MAG: pyrroline-5-carboxylate reductase [Bacillota bacterium]|nr:pyrroline-5-carboxylate reductase [Bacillota bacterium]